MLPATSRSKNTQLQLKPVVGSSGSSVLRAGRLTEMPYPAKLKLTLGQLTVHRVPWGLSPAAWGKACSTRPVNWFEGDAPTDNWSQLTAQADAHITLLQRDGAS